MPGGVGAAQLAAQILDVAVHGPVGDVLVRVVEVVQELGPREDPAGVGHEALQEAELRGGEVEPAARRQGVLPLRIHREGRGRLLLAGQPPQAPQHRLHPGHHLAGAEGLADVVVRPELEALGYRVFEISAVSHRGLRELSFALAEIVEAARERAVAEIEERPRIVLRPRAVDDSGFRVVTEGGSYGTVYRVLGEKPERWIQQTDFANDEAVGYLADRLQKLGIEDALVKAGATAGSTVVIGPGAGVVFDWEPSVTSAAEVQMGARGTDLRVDQSGRRTNQERRREYHERMDAKSEARAELERERKAGMWKDDES